MAPNDIKDEPGNPWGRSLHFSSRFVTVQQTFSPLSGLDSHPQELEDDALEKQQMLKAQSAELADEQHFEEAMEKLTEARPQGFSPISRLLGFLCFL